MIVVDTSALIAVAQNEALGPSCMATLEESGTLLISAATLAETLIVARGRGLGVEMAETIAVLELEIVPVTGTSARQAADAYGRWGKGFHAAKLNLGDCFAYALAKERDCPLLYIGNDFAQTDVRPALAQR